MRRHNNPGHYAHLLPAGVELIKSAQEYSVAIARLSQLWGHHRSPAEEREVDALVAALDHYERKICNSSIEGMR